MNKKSDQYILGISEYELNRLEFQHSVWKEVTDTFLEKLQIQKGWKILDVGSGPGFVSFEFLEKVGKTGEVTALEPSEFYLNYFVNKCKEKGWNNTKAIQSAAEDAELPENYYDVIFARWVIAFVPNPDLFMDKLLKSLATGGIIAFMDYAYEGLSLYPRGGAFENMAETVRAYWKHGGGDPYIGAKFPKMFRERNIELVHYRPVVLAGGPASGVLQWADRFFNVHVQQMIDMEIIKQNTGDAMLNDWNEHKQNPDTVFFSPILVNAAGRKSA
ncbi:MAG: methyltransferase domain-containing protein [Chlorobi bacterium]|nr:methyltransferase domain-containing protein [Chlorobiota bacterium]MCI0716020.1 methyltransferase domain-containing protein [Chlorobiota bacterium]